MQHVRRRCNNNEKESTYHRQYLVYNPISYADMRDNWLLDIEFYSEEFRADLLSIRMSELGMPMDSINSITYVDNTIMNNMFNYELKISDYAVRGIAEASISQLEYQTCKSSELDMIEKVLDYIGGEVNE